MSERTLTVGEQIEVAPGIRLTVLAVVEDKVLFGIQQPPPGDGWMHRPRGQPAPASPEGRN